MTARQRAAVGLVVSAVGLGILGDVLFHGRGLGVNAGVFAAAFVVALAVILRVGRIPLHQGRRLMAAPLLVFAALLAWHASPLLIGVNLLAIAGAVALGALRRTRRRVADAGVGDYVAGAAAAGASTFVGAIELMTKDLPWETVPERVRSREGVAIARGVALALPIVAIFGALFVAADSVFKSLALGVLPDPGHAWTHVLLAVVIGWLCAGLLRDLLASREQDRLLAPALAAAGRTRIGLGATEVAVALACVNVVFAAFVVVQIRYLFGGAGLVESRVHLTYAEYARHGFFELVAVAVLVLPLLLAVNALARGHRRARLVQTLSAVLVALVLGVMASALQRMFLYQREYGLTESRIYATGIILWLGCVFLLLAATVLRNRPRLFATGALVAGFAATLILNVVNPDALIARTNLSRPQVDAAYLGRLSDDAVPVLISRLPALDPDLRRPIATALLERPRADGSLLSWNASRERAQSLIDDHRAELERWSVSTAP